MILQQTRLHQERKKASLTQQEVATKLGIKLRQYQYIEAGTRRLSYEVLCKVEDLFGMTHRYLLAKTDGDYKDKLILQVKEWASNRLVRARVIGKSKKVIR